MAGVLAFCYLTNNYGFTSDWFIGDVKDLKLGSSFEWYKHAFAPANVFIDLADQRYFPNGFYTPGELLAFNLVGVNDLNKIVKGTVTAKLIDSNGNIVAQFAKDVELPAYQRINMPVFFRLPQDKGGYLILTEFKNNLLPEPVKSRRYIKVGKGEASFWEATP